MKIKRAFIFSLLLIILSLYGCGNTAHDTSLTHDQTVTGDSEEQTLPSTGEPTASDIPSIPDTETNDTSEVDPVVTVAPEENAEPSSKAPAPADPDTPAIEANDTPETGSVVAVVLEENAEPAPEDADVEQLSLSVDEASYPVGVNIITVTIHNRSGETVYFGDEYIIEYLADGEWKEVPLDYVFDSVENILQNETDYEFSVWLCPEGHDYTAGTYRVKKPYGIDGCVYAQFELR